MQVLARRQAGKSNTENLIRYNITNDTFYKSIKSINGIDKALKSLGKLDLNRFHENLFKAGKVNDE